MFLWHRMEGDGSEVQRKPGHATGNMSMFDRDLRRAFRLPRMEFNATFGIYFAFHRFMQIP